MKNLFLVIAIGAMFSLLACAQSKNEVPANIKTAFAGKFADAKNVKWSKENDEEWEAEFKLDGKEYSANFDTDGNWLETEYEINESDIPESVRTSINNEFAGFKIKESEISETKDGKFYEFELNKDGDRFEVSVDLTGKIVKKESESKSEDDED